MGLIHKLTDRFSIIDRACACVYVGLCFCACVWTLLLFIWKHW